MPPPVDVKPVGDQPVVVFNNLKLKSYDVKDYIKKLKPHVTERSKALFERGDPGRGFVGFLDLFTGELHLAPIYNKKVKISSFEDIINMDYKEPQDEPQEVMEFNGKNYAVISSAIYRENSDMPSSGGNAHINAKQKLGLLDTEGSGAFLAFGFKKGEQDCILENFRMRSSAFNILALTYNPLYFMLHHTDWHAILRSIPEIPAQEIEAVLCRDLPADPLKKRKVEKDQSTRAWMKEGGGTMYSEAEFNALTQDEIKTILIDNLLRFFEKSDYDGISKIFELQTVHTYLQEEFKNFWSRKAVADHINNGLEKGDMECIFSIFEFQEKYHFSGLDLNCRIRKEQQGIKITNSKEDPGFLLYILMHKEIPSEKKLKFFDFFMKNVEDLDRSKEIEEYQKAIADYINNCFEKEDMDHILLMALNFHTEHIHLPEEFKNFWIQKSISKLINHYFKKRDMVNIFLIFTFQKAYSCSMLDLNCRIREEQQGIKISNSKEDPSFLQYVLMHKEISSEQKLSFVDFFMKNVGDLDRSMENFLKEIADYQEDVGLKPLHLGALNGYLSVVEYMLGREIDINELWYGKTPLYNAAEIGYVDVVQYLLDNGAAINQTCGFSGKTALYIAAENGHLTVVKYLLEHQADFNLPCDGSNRTPLFIALENGHIGIVELLLQRGAHINQKCDINGKTPLYVAVENGNLPLVQFLLTKGADPHLKCDVNSKTPLHVAMENEYLGEKHHNIMLLLGQNMWDLDVLDTVEYREPLQALSHIAPLPSHFSVETSSLRLLL